MFGVRRAECLIGHYLLLASSLALALMPWQNEKQSNGSVRMIQAEMS